MVEDRLEQAEPQARVVVVMALEVTEVAAVAAVEAMAMAGVWVKAILRVAVDLAGWEVQIGRLMVGETALEGPEKEVVA